VVRKPRRFVGQKTLEQGPITNLKPIRTDALRPERKADGAARSSRPDALPPHRQFEDELRHFLKTIWQVDLQERAIQIKGIRKKFDLVSDGARPRFVGDAKYIKNIPVPAAKFSMIAEYVWLLSHVSAARRFLIFGHDRKIPERWLKRYKSLAQGIEFYFFTGTKLVRLL